MALQQAETKQLGSQLGFSKDKFDSFVRGLPLSRPEGRQLIQDALATLKAACDEAASTWNGGQQGEIGLVGSCGLGVDFAGDLADIVYSAPTQVPLQELHPKLSEALKQRPEVSVVGPVGADGDFDAPGMHLTLASGLVVKLFLASSPASTEQPPDALDPDSAALVAREVTKKLLEVVPDQGKFRDLMHVVRHWAQQRGVYGQGTLLGFLSGTAWAVCCARVCQMYPDLESPQLVAKFYRTMSHWDWRQPVSLLPPRGTQAPAVKAPSVDSKAVVVLLPVRQELSATACATETALRITQKELRRGYKMTVQVDRGQMQWSDMCSESPFFQRHRHYLELDFLANTPQIQEGLLVWGRRQMQEFVRMFETMRDDTTVTLRPWPKEITFRDVQWPCARAVFIGLHLGRGTDDKPKQRSFDLREPIVKFLEAVSRWPETPAYKGQFELLIRHMRISELEQWLEKQCQGHVQGSVGQSAGSLVIEADEADAAPIEDE